MKLLILGGTAFLGPHLVAEARRRGHDVTVFHRGLTGEDRLPDVTHLHGDRGGDLTALGAGRWDAVIDTSGQLPRHVRASVGLLAERAEHHLFVSSISVYEDFGSRGAAHGAAVERLEDPSDETWRPEIYGGLKAACEAEAEAAFPGRALAVRPGLIVGPLDPSERFTYWVRRGRRGGEILAPAPPERLVQVVDARDLAAWMIRASEQRLTGTFDATGPAEPLAFGQLVDTCIDVGGGGGEVTWIDADVLLERGVQPWSELPLWVPGVDMAVDCAPAMREGLRFRPLEETVRDTLEWAEQVPPKEQAASLSAEREAELLAQWRAREA